MCVAVVYIEWLPLLLLFLFKNSFKLLVSNLMVRLRDNNLSQNKYLSGVNVS
jgi:hypothetical protein